MIMQFVLQNIYVMQGNASALNIDLHNHIFATLDH